MTASQQVKAQGVKSLRLMSELTEVKERTLINWHKNKPVLFGLVLSGLVSELDRINKDDKNG